MSLRKVSSEPDLFDQKLYAQNFGALVTLVKGSIATPNTSASQATARPLTPYRPEALDELNDRFFRYSAIDRNGQKSREEARKHFQQILDEPVNSMASFVYNIRIEVDADTLRKGVREFKIMGDLCGRSLNEEILTTHCATAHIPTGSKLEVMAFDNLIDSIAEQFSELIETPESIRAREFALEVMHKANEKYGYTVQTDPAEEESDETIDEDEEEEAETERQISAV